MLGARDTFTARELVLCERAAFLAGINARPSLGDEWCGAACEAAKRYPLPTEQRPRVVHEEGLEWCVIDGALHHRQSSPSGLRWLQTNYAEPTAARIAMWADLLANPTETVEAEP